jgi:peptidoglycan/LPS O-acetylase OafA/YrhL
MVDLATTRTVLPQEEPPSRQAERAPGYVPGLDGMRAIGLVFMLAYHAGAAWAKGAIFTISMFFTLSGFLITSLLLAERQRSGGIDLRGFWVRRFRRLLPGALVVLGGVVVFGVTVADETQRAFLRGDVLAALSYVANWRFIATGQAYLDNFRTPSPVQHFWSLAIEEQFYLLLPLLAAGAMGLRRKVSMSSARWRLGAVLGVIIAASAALNLWGGLSPDRIYYGTDTRMAELLVGAFLGVLLCGRPMGTPTRSVGWRWALWVAGPLAMVTSVWIWVTVPKTSTWIYHGGFPAYALLSAVFVASANDPTNPVARLLRFRPMLWMGRRTYGIYLIHFPLFLWLSPRRTGLGFWPLFGLRVALTLVLASLLFRFVEEPMRVGRPLFGQPLVRLAPFVSSLIVISLMAATAEVDRGTVVTAAAQQGAELRVKAPEDADTSPAVPLDEAPPSTEAPATTAVPETTVPAPAVSETPTTAAPSVGRRPTPTPRATAPPTTSAPARSTRIVDALANPQPVPGGLKPKPIRRPQRRLRLMLVGDSSAVFLAYALADWNQQARIFDISSYGIMGCGLVRGGTQFASGVERSFDPICDRWPEIWQQGLRDAKPDLVVFAGSFHDVTDRRFTPDGPIEHIGQPNYDQIYLAEAARAADLLHSTGAPLLWLSNPPVREGQNLPDSNIVNGPANDPARMDRINDLIIQLMFTRPFIRIVDYANFFLTWPGGAFDPALREDGLHVDYEGRKIVGRWLGPEILDAYWRAIGR